MLAPTRCRRYSPFRHLVLSVCPNRDPATVYMAMFTAFFDASGTADSKETLFISGFVSTVQDWKRFEPKWYALLKEHGLSNPFHMTDFMAAKSAAYKPWKGRQLEFLRPALRLIKEHVSKDFSIGVVLADLARMHREFDIPPDHPFADWFKEPLAYCGGALIQEVWYWRDKQKLKGRKFDGDIRFIFDRGDKHRGALARAAREVYNVDIGFEDKAHFPPLQAADLIAWVHMRGIGDAMKNKPKPPPLLRELVRHLPGREDWKYTTWEGIQAFCEELGIPRKA